MDDTILFPSPNWFLVSNLAVSPDGWLVYGGPTKSLCALEPLPAESGVLRGSQKYKAHVVSKAHSEKILSVDVSPAWLEKRTLLSGSVDGSAKQWTLVKVNNTFEAKCTHSHDIHQQEFEEIIGVGYSTETVAVTVGSMGNIVKWELQSNTVKTYGHILKSFRPSCMACSPHKQLLVAIGTKQGVVMVLDLNGVGKVLYKTRGYDEDILNVSWCPVYSLVVKRTLSESKKRTNLAKNRLEKTRSELEKESNNLEQSGVVKNLPEDSFDESVVEEDDTFDIYKDHEEDEFGHKKYKPETVLVKVEEQKTDSSDYLAECLKLKDQIMKRKNDSEPSIAALVEALDNTHVEAKIQTDLESESTLSQEGQPELQSSCRLSSTSKALNTLEAGSHPHSHLLATVGKLGGVRIWSKTGKLVGSCAIPGAGKHPITQKRDKPKATSWPTVLWYQADTLLVVDGKNQVLECNPLQVDCNNKIDWRILHALHKRGLYCLASDAPRVQTQAGGAGAASVWSAAQDRSLVQYCVRSRRARAVHHTAGGFVYDVRPCPYDAAKIAISVGDGAVRVWQADLQDDSYLAAGRVATHWQNVQGKVLTVAWHPTRENMLAFATAEARVGVLDVRSERPARVLPPALGGAVYSLSWGEGMELYAAGNGNLVIYDYKSPDKAPTAVEVALEGQRWEVCCVSWDARGVLLGTRHGAVGVMAQRRLQAATFEFTKLIHALEWHPQQVSDSSEPSPYADLIAVSALDKDSGVVILQYVQNDDGTKELRRWKTLIGHKATVFQLAWSPHSDTLLLSTSQDFTARVWDVAAGACVAALAMGGAALSGAWHAAPALRHVLLAGGADCCLRLWDLRDHPPQRYAEIRHDPSAKQSTKTSTDKKKNHEGSIEKEGQLATSFDSKKKPQKRFILPITSRQINASNKLPALRKMVKMYLEKFPESNDAGDSADVEENGDASCVEKNASVGVSESGDSINVEKNGQSITTEETSGYIGEYDLDYLDMFGNINQVNELLDKEMEYQASNHKWESCMVLCMFRGRLDTMVQLAAQRDALCPYLLSLTPCVSHKYWKDVSQLYLAQIDRLTAKGEEDKLYESRTYGGPTYRKACTLLSVQDVRGAVAVLTQAKLYKEAYLLCRIRYLDSIAEDTLRLWAHEQRAGGAWATAAVCYLALGDASSAASALAQCGAAQLLALGARLGALAGRRMFAGQLRDKALAAPSYEPEKPEDDLEKLPTRIELLLKNDRVQSSDQECED